MNEGALRVARIIILVLLPVILALTAYRFMSGALLSPADPANTAQISIEISPGLNFKQVCKLMQEKGIVKYARSLDLLARLNGSPTDKIQAGEYLLSPAMEPKAILSALVEGKVYQRVITVVPGMSVRELGSLVERAGLLGKAELDAAIMDQKLLIKAGIRATSFEGYLWPETYNFSRPVTPYDVIWRMLEEAERKWLPEYNTRAEELGYSRHEILTLASIIEKESSSKVDEQPLIASVFHNRLKQGMKLQADPTVIYGIPNFNGNLTREHLATDTPYNTYIHFALPPGPICFPGASALKAALYPEQSTFLFFVADGTGGHVFSSTLAEHNEAVTKFQRPNS